MSRAVLISIKPKWCELIASGEKTVEVRKSRPKIATPFKVYVYATWNGSSSEILVKDSGTLFVADYRTPADRASGKVIGEFVCDEIYPIRVFENGSIQDYMCHRMERSCVPYDDIANYIGNDHTGYGWHISDLVIYDEPRELREFYHACTQPSGTDCAICLDRAVQKCWQITRPPQSWCYVEEGGQ